MNGKNRGIWLLAFGVGVSCIDEKSVVRSRSAREAMWTKDQVRLEPMVAKPTEKVHIIGGHFNPSFEYSVQFKNRDGKTVESPLTVDSGERASFLFPAKIKLGEVSFSVLKSNGVVGQFQIIAGDGTLDYFSGDASLICSTEVFFDRFGRKTKGTRNCSAGNLPNCSANAEISCAANSNFKAANLSELTAENIKNGVSIAGVQGTYTGISANPWDIRAGVTIGSVTGKLKYGCRNGSRLSNFDLAGYPLAATIDDTTDVITVVGHGWIDNDAVQIFYNSTPIGLGYGVTYYIRNSTTDSFQLSATSGGTSINITTPGSNVFVYRSGDTVVNEWETVDDFYGLASDFPSSWSSSNHLCGGIEATVDDDNVWKDVTTTGDGLTLSSCATTAAHCSFRDKISKLEWHKADTTARDWSTSLSFCNGLNYNGKEDWRLPTQKELYGAYLNGISSTADHPNWLTMAQMRLDYWTATTTPNPISTAWRIYLISGSSPTTNKFAAYRTMCVRP